MTTFNVLQTFLERHLPQPRIAPTCDVWNCSDRQSWCLKCLSWNS